MARTIVFFSTKGGVGKTFIATNVAVSLASDMGKRVLLIDLDFQAVADMSKILNLKPQGSIVDVIERRNKQSTLPTDKNDFVTPTKFGIDFLPVALNTKQLQNIEIDKVGQTLGFFERFYDYIIIDAGKGFSDILVETLNKANLVLLVVTPDILSIYQTKWVLDTLQSLQFPLRMVKLLLNRSESASSIAWQEVKLALPHEILSHIPSEGKSVMQSLNNGVPIVIDNPKSRVTMAIKKLAENLNDPGFPYVEHKGIDEARLREIVYHQSGDFWKKMDVASLLHEVGTEEENIDEILKCKQRIHRRLIEDLKLEKLDMKTFSDPKKMQELRTRAEKLVVELLVEELGTFISAADIRKRMVKEIMDEALGLGPLEDLLADKEINDIMVNNKDEVYVERLGVLEQTNKKFISNEQVKTIIERIIAPLGRRIDESIPMVDARLADGSRVNAIIPPLALTGPTLTIRKFRKERFTTEELVDLKTFSAHIAAFLKACVLCRKNIIVSGGTGSGKTTMLNLLSSYIPDNERIVTIEDAAELKLDQEHWVRLESRAPNIEGQGAVTIRDLFRNTLRMRPDRILIGECRGGETLDMLQAMNTGHDGSLTTIHANSTHDALTRLDSMILMSGVDMPVRSIREMIASAIDLIVHTARLPDGTRKVLQVTEILGMQDQEHIDMRDIFVFKQTGVDVEQKVIGDFMATGYVPTFLNMIKVKGIPINEDIFKAP